MADALETRALRLLARREHSRAELRRKLGGADADSGEIETLLDRLEQKGWLSERRVVEQVLRAGAGHYGSIKVGAVLRDKGVPEAMVSEAVREARAGDIDNAREVWRHKFGALPRDARERARQARFLQSRGFGMEAIHQVLQGEPEY